MSESNQQNNPGFIVVRVDDMTQKPAILEGLPSAIEGLIAGMGIKAEVTTDLAEEYEEVMNRLDQVAQIIIDADYEIDDVERIAAKYSAHLEEPESGEGEHPLFDRDEWIEAVQHGETQFGYWEYVVQQIAAARIAAQVMQEQELTCCGHCKG